MTKEEREDRIIETVKVILGSMGLGLGIAGIAVLTVLWWRLWDPSAYHTNQNRTAENSVKVIQTQDPAQWPRLIEALEALGGEADLTEIYAAIGPKRPTDNQFWKEQTRKVLQTSFRRTGQGRWSLPENHQHAA